MNKTTIGVIVLIIVVAIATLAFFFMPRNVADQTSQVVGGVASENEGVVSFSQVGPNAIYVETQRPSTSLIVTMVQIDKPSYVVIYESKEGEPEKVIGHTPLLPTGATKNIPVFLDRITVNDEELIAMLHAESGVPDFEPTEDLPLLDSEGTPIYMIFGITEDAPTAGSSEVVF